VAEVGAAQWAIVRGPGTVHLLDLSGAYEVRTNATVDADAAPPPPPPSRDGSKKVTYDDRHGLFGLANVTLHQLTSGDRIDLNTGEVTVAPWKYELRQNYFTEEQLKLAGQTGGWLDDFGGWKNGEGGGVRKEEANASAGGGTGTTTEGGGEGGGEMKGGDAAGALAAAAAAAAVAAREGSIAAAAAAAAAAADAATGEGGSPNGSDVSDGDATGSSGDTGVGSSDVGGDGTHGSGNGSDAVSAAAAAPALIPEVREPLSIAAAVAAAAAATNRMVTFTDDVGNTLATTPAAQLRRAAEDLMRTSASRVAAAVGFTHEDSPRYSVTLTRRPGRGEARAWEGGRKPGTSSYDGGYHGWGAGLQMTFLGVRLDIAPVPSEEREMLAPTLEKEEEAE
jgi:hypothetical protein